MKCFLLNFLFWELFIWKKQNHRFLTILNLVEFPDIGWPPRHLLSSETLAEFRDYGWVKRFWLISFNSNLFFFLIQIWFFYFKFGFFNSNVFFWNFFLELVYLKKAKPSVFNHLEFGWIPRHWLSSETIVEFRDFGWVQGLWLS